MQGEEVLSMERGDREEIGTILSGRMRKKYVWPHLPRALSPPPPDASMAWGALRSAEPRGPPGGGGGWLGAHRGGREGRPSAGDTALGTEMQCHP